jgi:hypothetical protein
MAPSNARQTTDLKGLAAPGSGQLQGGCAEPTSKAQIWPIGALIIFSTLEFDKEQSRD